MPPDAEQFWKAQPEGKPVRTDALGRPNAGQCISEKLHLTDIPTPSIFPNLMQTHAGTLTISVGVVRIICPTGGSHWYPIDNVATVEELQALSSSRGNPFSVDTVGSKPPLEEGEVEIAPPPTTSGDSAPSGTYTSSEFGSMSSYHSDSNSGEVQGSISRGSSESSVITFTPDAIGNTGFTELTFEWVAPITMIGGGGDNHTTTDFYTGGSAGEMSAQGGGSGSASEFSETTLGLDGEYSESTYAEEPSPGKDPEDTVKNPMVGHWENDYSTRTRVWVDDRPNK